MLLIYNFLMLAAICALSPVWIPLVALREKHRRTFFKRLFMPAITGAKNRAQCAANSHRIWIHALSVGEVLSAEPLVKALANKYGRAHLIFTTSTHTGFQTANRVIAAHVGAVRHFPYDTLFSVKRALNVIQPGQVVIVETDIWPNFLCGLNQNRIPVFLVNARLSDRSFRGYKRIGFLMAPLLAVFSRICVQTEADLQRFREIGVSDEKLTAVGNIKFDQAPVSIALEERRHLSHLFKLSPGTPVWVAGSTHPGEEEVLADACRQIRSSGIATRLMVAPRDPGRANDVCGIFNRAGIQAMTLGQMEKQPEATDVVAIDRIGILRQLYALADVAFVGGSLVRAGGHNPLEPASVAKPVLFGPHTDDFRWICRSLESAGGALRVCDSQQLAAAVGELILDKEKNSLIGERACAVFRNNRGAVERTLAAIGLDSDRREP